MFFYVTQSLSFHENSAYVFEFASIRIWKVHTIINLSVRDNVCSISLQFDQSPRKLTVESLRAAHVRLVTYMNFLKILSFFYRNLYYLRPAATTYRTKRPVAGRFTLSVSLELVLTLATFENRRTVSIDIVKTY